MRGLLPESIVAQEHILHIDFETRSTVDLVKTGVYPYAEHPSTEILCAAYAVDDEPVQLWRKGEEFPKVILDAISNGWVFCAQNANFERGLWAGVLTARLGIPAPTNWRCTQAMALSMGLPGSLANAAPAAGMTLGKDDEGRKVMLQLCKPRSVDPLGNVQWWTDAAKFQKLYAYCMTDVEVERQLFKRLMPLSKAEQKLWNIDQNINDRGLCIDTRLAVAANEILDAAREMLDNEMCAVTDGVVETCTKIQSLTKWLRGRGLEVASLGKDVSYRVLEEAKAAGDDDAFRAVKLRQQAAKSSTAKVDAMIKAQCADGRVRGLLQYHAATTGRWGGRIIQPQNMPRPKLSREEIKEATDVILSGDVLMLEALFGPPMDVVSSCLRAMLVAGEGKTLVAADFSAIEARVLAWLAEEESTLDVFRDSGKVYEHAAARIYNVGMADVTKDQRFIGKVAVLALGYGGGKVAFARMASVYGVELPESKAEEIKVAWRKANQKTVAFWAALEAASMEAVRRPGITIPASRNIAFRKSGSFLWCRLPSKRVICYPFPKIIMKETPWGEEKPTLAFKTVNSVTKKWGDTDTYGGKLAENITQAVSRDLLAEAIIRVESAGWPVVLHVHDEVVCEVPDSFTYLGCFVRVVEESPAWAEGLPLAAEGWVSTQFGK